MTDLGVGKAQGRPLADRRGEAGRPRAGRTDSGAADGLVSELAEFARASSPLNLDRSKLSGLRMFALAVVGSDSLAGVHSLVDEARVLLDEKPAEAVGVLLSDTDERWDDNLTTRKRRAAACLGISYEKLRKANPKAGRPSPYDVLLGQLAGAIRELAEPHGDVVTPPADGNSTPEARPRKWAWAWVSVTVVAALAALGVYLASRGGGSAVVVGPVSEGAPPSEATGPGQVISAGSTSGSTSTSTVDAVGSGANRAEEALRSFIPIEGCDIPLAGALHPSETDGELIDLVRSAYEEQGGFEAFGCPAHSLQQWGALWFQAFDGPTDGSSVVLTVEPATGTTVWMDAGLFSTYRYSAYEKPQELAGMPVSATTESGIPVLHLSGGGVVVAQYPNGPGYWIPAQAREVWAAHGGVEGDLGVPMANVSYIDGRLHQDYAGGYLELGDDGEVRATVVAPATAAEERAALPRTTEGILRAYDGTAWWVDEEGNRAWIPDEDTWFCLGGDGAVISPEVPGYVLATFPLEGDAQCS